MITFNYPDDILPIIRDMKDTLETFKSENKPIVKVKV